MIDTHIHVHLALSQYELTGCPALLRLLDALPKINDLISETLNVAGCNEKMVERRIRPEARPGGIRLRPDLLRYRLEPLDELDHARMSDHIRRVVSLVAWVVRSHRCPWAQQEHALQASSFGLETRDRRNLHARLDDVRQQGHSQMTSGGVPTNHYARRVDV